MTETERLYNLVYDATKGEYNYLAWLLFDLINNRYGDNGLRALENHGYNSAQLLEELYQAHQGNIQLIARALGLAS